MNEQPLNEILNKIKATETIKIYIPSLKADLDFKPLTLSQQRNIIDKISTTGYGLVDFFVNINDLIKLNCLSNFNSLNTIDRVNIIVSYRRQLSQQYGNIDLQKLLDKNKSIDLPDLKKTITTDRFSFEISAPSLVSDSKANSYLISTYKDEKQLLGGLMVNEICKFITKITVLDSNTEIDLTPQPSKNKWAIIENIESSHLKEVFNYINDIRNKEEEFVKFDDDKVDIGPELFIT